MKLNELNKMAERIYPEADIGSTGNVSLGQIEEIMQKFSKELIKIRDEHGGTKMIITVEKVASGHWKL